MINVAGMFFSRMASAHFHEQDPPISMCMRNFYKNSNKLNSLPRQNVEQDMKRLWKHWTTDILDKKVTAIETRWAIVRLFPFCISN